MLFALLCEKTVATYELLFTVLREMLPNFKPRLFLSNFEAGVIPAIKSTLPDTSHGGCFFHLGQSLNRKIQDLGLARAYRTDQAIKLYCRKLLALAFLPVESVPEAFNDLCDEAPNDQCKELWYYWR